MVLSKRERYAGIIAIAILGVLVLDKIVFTPLIESRKSLAADITKAAEELDRVNRIIATSERATRNWADMSRGHLPRDPSDAEQQVLQSISEWARESGMTLPAQKPERSEREGEFVRITFRATGTGQMSQVGRFLHRIQTASIPVRVTDITLTPRKEGTDDLAASIGIATIYHAPEDKSRLGATASSAGVSQ